MSDNQHSFTATVQLKSSARSTEDSDESGEGRKHRNSTDDQRTDVGRRSKSRRRTESRNPQSYHDLPKATCVDSAVVAEEEEEEEEMNIK